LASAESADVPKIVEELSGYHRWADEALRQQAETAETEKQRLHARLALLPVDAKQVEPLRQRLLEATPQELLVLRSALLPHRDQLNEGLWKLLEDRQAKRDQRFRAACALALFASDNPRWHNAAAYVVERLVTQDAVFLGQWLQALEPVRLALLPALGNVFHQQEPPQQKAVATDVLASYAADQPQVLAELLKDADERQWTVLWPKMQVHREAALEAMDKELDKKLTPKWADAPLDPAWRPLAPALVQQLVEAQGMVHERFALCQTLPLEQFDALAERLQQAGYRPVNFRPYQSKQDVRVAAVWLRDGRPARWLHGQSAADLLQRDKELRAQGYRPLDVAGYLLLAGKDQGADRYAALWSKPDGGLVDAQLYVGVLAGAAHTAAWQRLEKEGFVPRTQTKVEVKGQQLHSGVWWKPAHAFDLDFYVLADYEPDYESKLSPSNWQVDVRLAQAPAPPSTRERYTMQLAEAKKALATKPDDLNSRAQRAEALFQLGRDQDALSDLDRLIEKAPRYAQAYQWRALIRARRGQRSEAGKDMAQFVNLDPSPGSHAYLETLVVVYGGEIEAGARHLESTLAQHREDADFLYYAACAYALAAQAVQRQTLARLSGAILTGQTSHAFPLVLAAVVGEGPTTPQELKQRAVALLQQAVKLGYTNYAAMQTDSDLDVLHGDAGYRKLLRELHGAWQFAAVWHNNAAFATEEAHGLDPTQHLRRCLELTAQGYRPAALSVADLGEANAPMTASVWQRPVVGERDKDALARRQAQAAVALLQLGRAERVWPLLEQTPDPRLRTFLIHRLSPLGSDPQTVIARLGVERLDSIRLALLLCLGEFTETQLPASARESLAAQLLDAYRNDPDPGVHGAAEWLLRRWGHDKELRQIDLQLFSKEAQGGRRWYVNSQAQTMVILPAPAEFWMGSPANELDRHGTSEMLRRVWLPRKYALAAKEVTVEQFLQFRPRHEYSRKYSGGLHGPITNVSWFDAAAYCNWLSDKEGLERCYPQAIGPNMRMPQGYLKKNGYRLPTEAEWEFACRAGTVIARAFGVSDERMLVNYCWYLGNAQDHAHPVGMLKPNEWGFFDLYGNALEWCQEPTPLYRSGVRGTLIEDKGDIEDISDIKDRLTRGGAFPYSASEIRSACRIPLLPSFSDATFGFRVARTYP
jgi:formylglycine-generating enzyme required for sulfatase activity/tetratricopeptide (TPR) repeat protein